MENEKVSPTLADSIDAAIRTNRMEGLELSPEALALLKQVKCGDITLKQYEESILAKYLNHDVVEFISYDGKYPNMCSGIVTVKINGQIEKFKYCLEPRIPAAITTRKFEDYPGESYWVFDPAFYDLALDTELFMKTEVDREKSYLRKQAQKPMKENIRLKIEKIINEYLPQRCCEGCD